MLLSYSLLLQRRLKSHRVRALILDLESWIQIPCYDMRHPTLHPSTSVPRFLNRENLVLFFQIVTTGIIQTVLIKVTENIYKRVRN